jgi:hypothetical protein
VRPLLAVPLQLQLRQPRSNARGALPVPPLVQILLPLRISLTCTGGGSSSGSRAGRQAGGQADRVGSGGAGGSGSNSVCQPPRVVGTLLLPVAQSSSHPAGSHQQHQQQPPHR